MEKYLSPNIEIIMISSIDVLSVSSGVNENGDNIVDVGDNDQFFGE